MVELSLSDKFLYMFIDSLPVALTNPVPSVSLITIFRKENHDKNEKTTTTKNRPSLTQKDEKKNKSLKKGKKDIIQNKAKSEIRPTKSSKHTSTNGLSKTA